MYSINSFITAPEVNIHVKGQEKIRVDEGDKHFFPTD